MSQDLAPATGAVERCLETLAHHAKSFNFASRVLPRECRAEAAVLYAWCRAADDAIDLAPRGSCRENLALPERDLDDVYAGRPQTDLVSAIATWSAAEPIPAVACPPSTSPAESRPCCSPRAMASPSRSPHPTSWRKRAPVRPRTDSCKEDLDEERETMDRRPCRRSPRHAGASGGC